MKSMRIVGLALVAVFALSAFAASSAFALPEYGRCIPKSLGKYTESNCQHKSSAKEPGSFERSKLVVLKKFTSAGGAGTLETVGGNKVTCTTQAAAGEYKVTTSTKEVQNVVATFTGCEAPLIGAKCNTAGKAAGEIVTNSLTGKIGYTSKPKKEAGQELHPTVKKGKFASFECTAAVKIEVGEGAGKGGDCIIAPVKPTNVSSLTAEQVYSGSGGVQSPQHFEGSLHTCNLESNLNGGAFERATQALVTTVTSEEAVEIFA